jgi:tetratricopeptide (TPR) repeat protein
MTTVAHPKDAAANRGLAKLYLSRGSYQHAYDTFEIVAENDSTADDARYQQAVCSMEMNQPAQAQKDIKKALAVQPNNPAYIALEGSADAAAGNTPDGIAELERAANLAPKDVTIQAALVNLLLTQHRNAADLAAAEETIARMEQLSPDYPQIPLDRAKLEMLKRNWQSAARYFEISMKITPNVDDIYMGLNQAYHELGRAAEAGKMLAEYHRRQDLRKRIQIVSMALSANPKDIDAYGNIAALEMQLGNPRSAAEAIKAGLRIDPANTRLQGMQSALEQMAAQPK